MTDLDARLNNDSAVPTYSHQKDGDASSFSKKIDGRIINSVSDQYNLPSDNEEWNRLNLQHQAITIGLGGLYPEKDVVQAALAPQEGYTKQVLDLGWGSGVWAIEMAKQFPWVQLTGLDLAPCPIPPKDLPTNCQFKVHDINTGLSQFENQFDMIHIRFVGCYLKDIVQRMKEIHACLKPGGIVLWIEYDFKIYGTEQIKYIYPATGDNPDGSWVSRILAELRRACMEIGSDVDGIDDVVERGLWSDPYIDSETCKNFDLSLPIGPWATSEDKDLNNRLGLCDSLMRQDLASVIEAFRPTFAQAAEMKTKSLWRLRLAFGRRKALDGGPAPPLPRLKTHHVQSDEQAIGSKSHRSFPFYFVYDSQQAALDQATMRKETKPPSLPPLPGEQ
ncbi:S-adenosyl-L-methionine-dependent methyltransferase [Serendipita vermifera]|nr:S-adenosyl-L-methionine-dependent methyltransferase [Serendipita vermifera]